MESTYKVLPLHQYFWSEISREWNNSPLNFFWNLHGSAFRFLNFVKWEKYKATILLILLQCIVLGYSNGNESFTSRLLSNYGSLNMLFSFFPISDWWCFSREFCQKVYGETFLFQFKFQKLISRCCILQKIKMSNFVIMKWLPLEGKKWHFWDCFFRN